MVSTCKELEKQPAWPGRFPTNTSGSGSSNDCAIMLNIQTDGWPDDTAWTWEQKANKANSWDILDGSYDGYRPLFLHSWPLPITQGSSYRLSVVDYYSDGIHNLGWITLTAGNETVLFSFPSNAAFSEIRIDIVVGDEYGAFNLSTEVTADGIGTRV